MDLRRFLFAFPLAVALSVAAVASASAQTRSFTDDAGRTVEIPERIERVMAAGPPASVLLYALAPDRMLGWNRALREPERPFIAEPYRDLPEHGRLTGRGGTANVEAVLAMRPDVIVDTGTINETYISLADRVQEQTGIPYVLIGGDFADTALTLRRAGSLLGEEERAEELARYAEKTIERLGDVLDGIQEHERPRVFYGRGPQGLETGVGTSINVEVLAAVGAVNVAQSAGSGGLANVSVEQVLSWDPEVILTLDPTFHQSLRDDPLWAGVDAVRNGRIYRAPTLPFGWFDAPPGINRLIGVAWLTWVLYPQAGVDLRQETRDFFRLFYHVDPTEEQLDTLLADAQGAP